ncbi:hypothetical protein BDY24DRAFT_57531 [Mrakia frigida]|uniref:uncharacterized protein n=1 Tax=Mrakia frigida TaxID=29902 RepID=UPI003FCC0A8C
MNKIAPRRRLPWDVLLLVFKQADPSTLAVLGRVSHDFLTATALELYRDVVVTSMKQLEGLFCERKVVQAGRKTKVSSLPSSSLFSLSTDLANPLSQNPSKTSRINSHLSLSHIHTLIIDFTSLSSRVPNSLSLSSSRLDDEQPLPLEHLEVSSDYSKVEVLQLLYSSLFRRLDPTRCSYKIVGRALSKARWVGLSRNYMTQPLGWTRIQTLDLSGILPCVSLNGHRHLAGLPSPFPDHRQVLRLHVASLLFTVCRDAKEFVDLVGEHPDLYNFGERQARSVVLVVKSEEEKRDVEAAVEESPEIEGWRHVFAVELET